MSLTSRAPLPLDDTWVVWAAIRADRLNGGTIGWGGCTCLLGSRTSVVLSDDLIVDGPWTFNKEAPGSLNSWSIGSLTVLLFPIPDVKLNLRAYDLDEDVDCDKDDNEDEDDDDDEDVDCDEDDDEFIRALVFLRGRWNIIDDIGALSDGLLKTLKFLEPRLLDFSRNMFIVDVLVRLRFFLFIVAFNILPPLPLVRTDFNASWSSCVVLRGTSAYFNIK